MIKMAQSQKHAYIYSLVYVILLILLFTFIKYFNTVFTVLENINFTYFYIFLKWNTTGGKKREKQTTKRREHKTHLMCKTASLRILYIMKQNLSLIHI